MIGRKKLKDSQLPDRVIYREAHSFLEELSKMTHVPLPIIDDVRMRKAPHTAAVTALLDRLSITRTCSSAGRGFGTPGCAPPCQHRRP